MINIGDLVGKTKGFLGEHKIWLIITGGLLTANVVCFTAWHNAAYKFKTLQLAYQNQEKKLNEVIKTSKKLSSRVNKHVDTNIVTRHEVVTTPDGTKHDIVTTTDTSKIDTKIDSKTDTTTSDTKKEETHVVLPNITRRWTVGVGYGVLGYAGASTIEKMSGELDYHFSDIFGAGVRVDRNGASIVGQISF